MGSDEKNERSELEDASTREQVKLNDGDVKTYMSNRRIIINLLLVTVAFLLNMGSYMTMEGLQSSLNAGAGTQSVSAIYAAFVLTSFFLPTLAMEFFKSRKAMVLGTLPYALYSIANCYAKPYTLIPAGVLLGSGASVVWSANRVYISDLSGAYAKQNKRDEGKTTSHFYGIFWAIFSLSLLIGNVVSSAVLQAFALEKNEVNAVANSTQTYSNLTVTSSPTTASVEENEQVVLRCAMHNCDDIPGNATDGASEGETATLNPGVLYALFGTFAAIQLGSAFLLLFCADDAPDRQPSSKAVDMAWKSSDEEKVTLNGSSPTRNDGDESTVTERVKKQTLATAKFLLFNHSAKALIPITIHIGVLQGYAFGQFTKYWVTCVIGIEYVGYVASMFGLGSTAGGYGAGFLAQHTGRFLIMVAAWILEMAVTVFLLIWEPELTGGVWVFFLTFFLVGILHATYKTIITTATTLFFSDDKEAASASLSIWDPLGSAVAYAISTTICNRIYTILLMVLVTIGTILYLIIERQYTRRLKNSEKAVST